MPVDLPVIWLTVSSVIVGAYSLLLILFFIRLISRNNIKTDSESLHITLLIPFKNEGIHLRRRIENAQSLQKCNWVSEVIFINDHSADLTQVQLNEFFQNTSLKLIHLPANASGKKFAIHFGVAHSTGSWVLTSDADTTIDPELFLTLSRKVNAHVSCIILPVRPLPEKGAVRALFDLEFMALQAVGLASAKMHLPLLANGAALFFLKDAYLRAASQRTDWNISGGDDLFTMFSIVRNEGRRAVHPHIDKRSFAEAEFPKDFDLLWKQRLRWIQKVPGIGGVWYTGVAWLVLAANVIFVALWIISGFTASYSAAGYMTMLKTLPELFILGWAVLYFQRRETAWWIGPGILIYPFYLTALILSGIFIKPAWK